MKRIFLKYIQSKNKSELFFFYFFTRSKVIYMCVLYIKINLFHIKSFEKFRPYNILCYAFAFFFKFTSYSVIFHKTCFQFNNSLSKNIKTCIYSLFRAIDKKSRDKGLNGIL